MGFTSILLTVGVPVAIEHGVIQVTENTLAALQEGHCLQVDLTKSENCSRRNNGGKNGGEMHSDGGFGGYGRLWNFYILEESSESCLWVMKQWMRNKK